MRTVLFDADLFLAELDESGRMERRHWAGRSGLPEEDVGIEPPRIIPPNTVSTNRAVA